MKNINLRYFLQRTSSDQNILVGANRRWNSAELQAGTKLPVLSKAGCYDNVALRLMDPIKLALALVALDGVVKRMLLLSPDLPSQDAAVLLRAFEPDAILSDLPSERHFAGRQTIAWTEPPRLEAIENDCAPPRENMTEWILATSGTTGTPKLVVHNLLSLARTTKVGSTRHRWGQLYDMSRFAGLQVFLQGLLGGTLLLPPLEWSLAQRLRLLTEHGCTALSATPTLWRKLLMTPGIEALAPQQITMGGEIADDAILAALARRYPSARIVHVYASTEVGAAFSVKDGRAGFPLSYLADPPGHYKLKVKDNRLFIQTGSPSPVYLRGENPSVDEEGFIDTGDAVRLVADRYYFSGRANGAINVGGNKVLPEEVEQVLLDHPDVQLARVGARRSPITGQLVIAEIVPADRNANHRTLKSQLRVHCENQLSPWKVPGIIHVVATLETKSGGKLVRNDE